MTNHFKKKAIIGTIWSQFGKFAEIIALFMLSIVLARGFGPEVYGIYASILAFFNLLAMFASFGLEQMLANFVPKNMEKKGQKKISAIVKKALLTRLSIHGGLLIIVLILSHHIGNLYFGHSKFSSYFFVAALYFFSKDISKLISFYYIGKLKTKFVTFVETSALLTSFFISIIIFKLRLGIFAIFLSFGVIYSISFLVYLWGAKEILFKTGNISFDKEIWTFSRTVWINSAMAYVLGKQSDILMLRWFSVRNISIGFYNLSFSLVSLAGSVLMAGLSIVTLPIVSGAYSRGGEQKLRSSWRLLIAFSNMVSIPILAFLAFNSKPIVILLYSEKYAETSVYITIFAAFTSIGRLLGGGINTGVLYAIKKEKYIMYVTFLTGSLNVLFNLLLIPYFEAIGALIGTGFSSLISIIILFMIVTKRIKAKYPLKMNSKIVLAAITSIGATTFALNYLCIDIIICGFIYGTLYVGALFLLKPFSRVDLNEFDTAPIIYRFVSYFSQQA
jgi:O-antigen/teichoic acid export membrane protein